MGNSPCISPWDEEANAFLHVTWKGIGWLRWLNGRMANRMVNGRFPMTWRGNYIFSCDMKRHWLVEKIKFINFNWVPMTKIILNPMFHTMSPSPCIFQDYVEFDTQTITMLEKLFVCRIFWWFDWSPSSSSGHSSCFFEQVQPPLCSSNCCPRISKSM
jgi:hypothetical protein